MDAEKARIVVSMMSTYMNHVMLNQDEECAEEEMFLECLREEIEGGRRNTPNRIQNYIEGVIPSYSPREFQSHFRLTRLAFQCLLENLGPLLSSSTQNRKVIDPERQLLVTLWLLATPDSFRSVGERFNMGKSSVFICFLRVIKALNQIAHKIIRWPTEEESLLIEEKFRSFAGLRGVVGAIDGTYVPIKAPRKNAERYINRKCFHAVTLQAIATHELKFIDCFAGYPSSVGDRRIFTNSDIYRDIYGDVNKYFGDNKYIIGDKAYPVLKWCIPPYIERGTLPPAHTRFNTIHAKTRQVVERAFALLFGRFRRLKYLDMNRVDLIPHTILACCVLHNLCLSHDDILINQYIEEGSSAVVGEHLSPANMGEQSNRPDVDSMIIDGLTRRDQLALGLGP